METSLISSFLILLATFMGTVIRISNRKIDAGVRILKGWSLRIRITGSF